MNSDMLMGIARAMIPGAAAAMAHWGLGTDAEMTAALTAVATGLVAAWSAWANTQASKIASINNADNGVKVVAAAASAPQVNAPLK
jgi:hypothetical protein